MICAINQPTYLPWIGYFDLIDQVDIFIYYDDVKITRSYWDVRNKIKSKQGELFLTVPIKRDKSHQNTLFINADINNSINWRAKHLKSFSMNYIKSPYYNEVFEFLSEYLSSQFKVLADLNIGFISNVAKKIGIETATDRASNMGVLEGESDKRLVSVCNKVTADTYLSPIGSADYIEKKQPGGELIKNKIELYYQNYHHPEYPQLYGEFLSHMSILDMLFNCGFDNALDIIRSGRKKSIHYKNVFDINDKLAVMLS